MMDNTAPEPAPDPLACICSTCTRELEPGEPVLKARPPQDFATNRICDLDARPPFVGRFGFRFSFARSPTAQQLSEIERVDHAIAIDIRGATRARPPTAEQQGQVKRVHRTTSVEISRTGSGKLVGASIHSAILDSRHVVEVAVGQRLDSCEIGIGIRAVVSGINGR